MCRNTEVNDRHLTLVTNVDNGLKMFEDASKEYTAALRNIDVALEHFAVAFRQLSLGDLPKDLRLRVETFGTAMASRNNASSPAVKKGPDSKDPNANGEARRSTVTMPKNDLPRSVAAVSDQLKLITKMVRRKMDERNSSASKYNKARIEVEEIARKDAKKNRNSSDNPVYIKKMKSRDALCLEAEKKEKELERCTDELLQRRSEAMNKVMTSVSTCTSNYWSELGEVMRSFA